MADIIGKDLDEVGMAKLAREMAMNIRNYKAIFADFGITEEDYYLIEKNEFYKRAKEQFSLEWNSALSVADRVKLQAAAGLEVMLPIVGRRMMAETEPLSSVIEGAKFYAKTAGIGESKNEGKGNTEKFSIVINLTADEKGPPIIEEYSKTIEIEASPVKP